MERSIETIWKEGFLKGDAVIAPKLNNLYNQKSIHLIDKFKRMFKINLNAIVIGAVLFLIISFFIKIPIMGIGFFVILSVVVIVNRKLLKGLDRIDKSDNSYHYLLKFDHWMKEQLAVNKKMARVYYPLFFLSTVLGFWYSNFRGKTLGEKVVDELTIYFSDLFLLFGIPISGLVLIVIVAGLLAIFGNKIYSWDVNLIYGRVFSKLDEIISDMEELRK